LNISLNHQNTSNPEHFSSICLHGVIDRHIGATS
jgi:hypothetical protein